MKEMMMKMYTQTRRRKKIIRRAPELLKFHENITHISFLIRAKLTSFVHFIPMIMS